MSEPTSTTAIMVKGAGMIGAGLAYASAVASDIPIPEPTTHGMMELLVVTMLGWVVKEIRSNKTEPSESISGEHQTGWRQMMLKMAEDAVLGTKDIGEQLTKHRIEYAAGAARTEERLDTIEGQIRILNKHNSGEINRPKEIRA